MTVKQLQEKLRKMPQDAEVVYFDSYSDNGPMYVNEVEVEHETELFMYPHLLNPQGKTTVIVLSE